MVACAMGFSAHLQSRAAHEALLGRQDAELRLLDTVRRCVAAKLKSDRDYATALAAVAAQGLKLERADELSGSLVAQAWRSMMEELEAAGRALRQGAETLEARAVDRLNALYAEKRRSRKAFQEEYGRIAQQMAHLTEDVSRKKAEYEKYLQLYRLMRSRFEEHYVKSGRSGRKLDEVRDKFQKACRKLHLTHNEYVLLLSEAVEFEREYRGVLLPGLLHRQQAAQEAFVSSWSEVLREVAQNLSFGSDKFGEIQQRVEAAVSSIKPSEEYSDFAERYKTPATTAPSAFVFDDRLAEDTSGKLLPGRLAVDNLTVDSLRSKLADLESALRELQPTPPAPASAGATTTTATAAASGATAPSSDATAATPPPAANGTRPTSDSGSRHCSTSSECGRAEAAEQRCKERQIGRQLELVRGALAELGCEEVPSGCDLSGLDTSFDSSAPAAAAATASSAPAATPTPAASTTSVVVTPNANATVTDGAVVRPTTPAFTQQPQQQQQAPQVLQSDESTFTMKRQLAQQRLVSLLRKPFRRKSAPSTPVLGRGGTSARGGSEPTDDKVSTGSPRTLADEDWFHGVLPREEVVRLLTREGDFLVRETTRNDECQTVLSVCWGGHKHFIVQTTAEGHFRFEGPAFPTIQELIVHQYQSGLPVTSRSGAVLRKPILRERWELNNDDVILLDKIGRGNFGDVYKAKLKTSKQEVAVKTCRMTLPDEHKKKFLQEGRILKQYDHPNIVKLIGICVQKQPIMIVMELVPGGSLLTFLRNRAASLTQKQLLGMCRDAAAGMRYLESKNCIHRDLAARNCLVGYDNIVKISDFGMSREEEEYIVSDGMKQIPIKWTAPEALNFGKYTSLCDVWSYGVLSWEIFARGGTPYSGMSNSKAREKIDSGYRMPAPEGTPDEMYRLMLRCWEYEPENRPHFEQIFLVVDTLYGAQR